MKKLLAYSEYLLRQSSDGFTRYLYHHINWDNRLIAIIGSRGIGKTTFLLQHLAKEGSGSPASVYMSLDDLYFTIHTLTDVVDSLYSKGCKVLALDEVHKYPTWAKEINSISDRCPGLKIIFAGSSVVDLEKENSDLSSKTALYKLHGLSYREYLHLRHDLQFDPISLQTLLQRSRDRQTLFPSDFRPLRLFKEYIKHGYYPFDVNEQDSYDIKLQQMVRKTVEYDMAELKGFDVRNAHKLLLLLGILSVSTPIKPNISKLAEQSGIHRNSLVPYLHYLENAGLIQLLYSNDKSATPLQKPKIIYLNNSNLLWNLSPVDPAASALRKSFIMSQLKAKHFVSQPESGDFLADNIYFNVDDQDLPEKQISGLDLVSAKKEGNPSSNKDRIPLWLFGLLY